jgi:DNA-binding HxlR family transcriptional regulator
MELLNRRWMLRVIWELRQGPITFRALRTACSNVSASVLNQRLADLKAAGLVEHQDKEGYVLNDVGRRLLASIQPLMKWAIEWHKDQN